MKRGLYVNNFRDFFNYFNYFIFYIISYADDFSNIYDIYYHDNWSITSCTTTYFNNYNFAIAYNFLI